MICPECGETVTQLVVIPWRVWYIFKRHTQFKSICSKCVEQIRSIEYENIDREYKRY